MTNNCTSKLVTVHSFVVNVVAHLLLHLNNNKHISAVHPVFSEQELPSVLTLLHNTCSITTLANDINISG